MAQETAYPIGRGGPKPGFCDMEFTLYFRGDLPSTGRSKGKPQQKHEIRTEFHRQLKRLWAQPPLDFLAGMHDPEVIPTLGKVVADVHFVSLVSSSLNAFVDLQVTLLRPGPVGKVISAGGDLDNRLKTLFDALSVPQANQIPSDYSRSHDETPFFCLLEDDRLIGGLAVSTGQLLVPDAGSSEAIVLVNVRTRITHLARNNYFLG